MYSIPLSCLFLVYLLANIVLLGTSLMRTKLEGYRMECNICPDAIFLTHSEMLYFLGIFVKEDLLKYRKILHFHFTKKST